MSICDKESRFNVCSCATDFNDTRRELRCSDNCALGMLLAFAKPFLYPIGRNWAVEWYSDRPSYHFCGCRVVCSASLSVRPLKVRRNQRTIACANIKRHDRIPIFCLPIQFVCFFLNFPDRKFCVVVNLLPVCYSHKSKIAKSLTNLYQITLNCVAF